MKPSPPASSANRPAIKSLSLRLVAILVIEDPIQIGKGKFGDCRARRAVDDLYAAGLRGLVPAVERLAEFVVVERKIARAFVFVVEVLTSRDHAAIKTDQPDAGTGLDQSTPHRNGKRHARVAAV